mgnify:CR=1 FL=1
MKLYIMQNFIFQNPVKILFGKGMASEMSGLIPAKAKILLLYGGGSVKKNGSYDQTVAAIGKRGRRDTDMLLRIFSRSVVDEITHVIIHLPEPARPGAPERAL